MRQFVLMMVLAGLLGSDAFAQGAFQVWTASAVSADVFAFDPSGGLTTSNTSLAANAGPRGVAVSESGNAFFSLTGTGQILMTDVTGTTSLFAVPGNPKAIALDASSDLYVADSSLSRVFHMAAPGVVVATLTLPGAALTGGLAINANNEIWVADSAGTVWQMSTKGQVIRSIVPGLGAGSGVAVDKNGDCWVTFRQSNRVVKYNRSTGNADVTITSANQPVAVTVNNANDIYVVSGTIPGQVTYYSSLGQLGTSVNTPQQLLGVSLDGNGDVWATGQTGGLYKYDRHTLSSLVTVNLGIGQLSPENWGDFTGYAAANIVRSTDDYDQDTFDNRTELDAESNPFTSASTPPTPQPILSGRPSVGATVYMTFRHPADATLGYSAAGSMGNNPQNFIQVPNTQRVIPLEADPFYHYSINNFWVFQNTGGLLDGNGQAIGRINIPNDSQLTGVTVYMAFITLDQSLPIPVKTISSTYTITVL